MNHMSKSAVWNKGISRTQIFFPGISTLQCVIRGYEIDQLSSFLKKKIIFL